MNFHRKSDRPVAVDLFAGCGGFSLGFEQAGFDIVAAIDIDEINCKTHKLNFPYCSTICTNIQNISGNEIRIQSSIDDKEIDVVIASPPCQGFSLIGKRNLEDERNNLLFEFLRLVVELQPRYFLMENVKGLTIGKSKLLLLDLINQFKQNNYKVEDYQVLNAANFNIPQHRERLFLIGCREDLTLPNYPKPITKLPNDKKKLIHLPVCPTVFDAINDLPTIENFSELFLQDWIVTNEYKTPSEYSAKLRNLIDVENDFSYKRNFDKEILTGCSRTVHTEEVVKRFEATEQGKVEKISRFLKLNPNGVSNTLRAGTGSFTAYRPIHYSKPRVVTVRECARLHSFPDWFQFHETKIHSFRQVGNSVPPLLGRAVANEVIKSLGIVPSKPCDRANITNR